MTAIDAGATEFELDEEESVLVYTESARSPQSRRVALGGGSFDGDSSELIMKPKHPVTPETDLAIKVIRLVERLLEEYG